MKATVGRPEGRRLLRSGGEHVCDWSAPRQGGRRSPRQKSGTNRGKGTGGGVNVGGASFAMYKGVELTFSRGDFDVDLEEGGDDGLQLRVMKAGAWWSRQEGRHEKKRRDCGGVGKVDREDEMAFNWNR